MRMSIDRPDSAERQAWPGSSDYYHSQRAGEALDQENTFQTKSYPGQSPFVRHQARRGRGTLIDVFVFSTEKIVNELLWKSSQEKSFQKKEIIKEAIHRSHVVWRYKADSGWICMNLFTLFEQSCSKKFTGDGSKRTVWSLCKILCPKRSGPSNSWKAHGKIFHKVQGSQHSLQYTFSRLNLRRSISE